jgi:glutathione S-transferase
MEKQLKTTQRALDHFEGAIDGFGEAVALDGVTLACALAYLDFRFPDDGWRESRPKLMAWFAGFDRRPSMRTTQYAG